MSDLKPELSQPTSRHIFRRALAYLIDLTLSAVLLGAIFSWTGLDDFNTYGEPLDSSYGYSFTLAIGNIAPPFIISTTTTNTATHEFVSLALEKLPEAAIIRQVQFDITRNFGVAESFSISGIYDLPGDKTQRKFQIPFGINSLWFRLSEQITLLLSIVMACAFNALLGRSPGKFLTRLQFRNQRPKQPVLRELIKTVPLTFTALLSSPLNSYPNLQVLDLETAWTVSQVGTWGGFALMIVFWLWPLGAETRRFLWSPNGEVG